MKKPEGVESDWSTDTEQLVARIEREVVSSPVLTGERALTIGSLAEELVARPSSVERTRQLLSNITRSILMKSSVTPQPTKTQKGQFNC